MADGFMIDNIFIPNPKTVTLKPSDLKKTFPLLGLENMARAAMNPFTAIIESEIKANGYQEHRGPRPWCVEGAGSPGDGSGRFQAIANLEAVGDPSVAKLAIKIDVYPKLTEEQLHALMHRAVRSTAPFTEKDYYKGSMNRWMSHPGEEYIDHLRGMGLEFAFLFFTPAPESALDRTKNAKGQTVKLELKKGVTSDDLWGKNKGGQKQGPIQVGWYLAKAHPRAREAFFDAWGEDKAHSIGYTELMQTVKQWEEDKKLRPDLASPPVSFEELAEKFPNSALVKGILGARIKDGKQVQGGRDKGKGRMDQKAADAYATTLGAHSEDGPIILARHERTAGYTSEEGLRLTETVMACNKILRDTKVTKEDGSFLTGKELEAVLTLIQDTQKKAKEAIKRVFSMAAAEAEAARLKIIELEQAKAAKRTT